MNYIGIDPSLTCTGVTVNDRKFVYASQLTAHTKTGKLNKWFDVCSGLCTYRFHDLDNTYGFSDSEIGKLSVFDVITSNIIKDVLEVIDPSTFTSIGIEGYSYSSVSGPLIDLVTFGTLLRHKLLNDIPRCVVTIIPPTALKLKAAQLTYKPIEKGKTVKKYEWRNDDGVAGGSFNKHEMLKCLTENENLECEWVKFLRTVSDDIHSAKSVPKPIEDLNDSKLIYEILRLNK